MTATRDRLIKSVWAGLEPFLGAGDLARVDTQGWASDHVYLTQAINEVMPQVVVEVGVWKGGSVMTMARRIQELKLDAAVIAVDTWLGAWDHWIQNEWFGHLRFEDGYPTLYRTFSANIVAAELTEIVMPLPLDSINAANVLKSRGVIADILHIDGGHDYEAVMSDLSHWWALLRPGGILIGDDYHASGNVWPDVRRAFHTFFNTDRLENTGGKCIVRKNVDTSAVEARTTVRTVV